MGSHEGPSECDESVTKEIENPRELRNEKWDVGCRVKLHSLVKSHQLNGSLGVITFIDVARGRIGVVLDRALKTLLLRPDNLVFDHLVKFVVGGTEFFTTEGTLENTKNTYFSALLSFPGKDGDDATVVGPQVVERTFILDRDPSLFNMVLSFLRDGHRCNGLPSDPEIRAALHQEADFYRVDALLALLASSFSYHEALPPASQEMLADEDRSRSEFQVRHH